MTKEAPKAKLGLESQSFTRHLSSHGDCKELSASLDLAPVRLSLLRPPQISYQIHRHDSSIMLCARCVWTYFILFANTMNCAFVHPKCQTSQVLPTFHYFPMHAGTPFPSRASVCPRLSHLSRFLPEISNILRRRVFLCNPTSAVPCVLRGRSY